MSSRSRASFALAVTLAAALVTGGCARLIASYDVAPSGLLRTDDELRRFLARGHADSALLRMANPKKQHQLPKDDLLRVLYEGVAAHYAGDYQRSTMLFDLADWLAGDRVTKSISQAALSVMVNDLALAYEPSRTERLLIPYYGALSFIQAGDYSGAAVEARRLSHLLQLLEGNDDQPDPELHGFLRNFAGIVFEAAGPYNDADVAYRNAAALDSRYARTPRPDGMGEVVVFIEHGFAPYRVQESLIVTLGDAEAHYFDDEDDERRRRNSSLVAKRVLEFANTNAPRTGEPRARTLFVPAPSEKASHADLHAESCDSSCQEEDEDHSYVLRMSWPVMYAPYPNVPDFALRIDTTSVAAGPRVDIGRAVYADFLREQPVIVARTIARAVAKYAITRGLEEEAEKKDEGLARLAGALANIGGAITEQADTRSWHFLPGSVSVVRYALPPGTHQLQVADRYGAPIDLGNVAVRGGRISILSTRVWN